MYSNQWIYVSIILIILIILIWVYIYQLFPNKYEHFENETKSSRQIPTKDELQKNYKLITLKKQQNVYDKSYVLLYTKLFDDYKNKLTVYSINDLVKNTKLLEYGSRAVIADLGCGTGTHLVTITQQKIKPRLYGVDTSRQMLDKAHSVLKAYTPTVRLLETSFDYKNALTTNTFTHITCYYFSFYYSKNHKQLLQNIYKWLVNGGFFCVHLVDINKFDPVLDAANPFIGISLQSYMSKRKRDSVIILNDCIYQSNFTYHPSKNIAYFNENIIYDKENTYRKNIHKLNVSTHNQIIEDARLIGFKLRNITPLYNLGYEYQYLCYLQK